MIDNPIATGAFPYNDPPEADYFCPRCEAGLAPDETVYEWIDDYLCRDCYKDAILSIGERDRAEMSGESIAYTEQMLEAYGFEPSATADFLHTGTALAEDVL